MSVGLRASVKAVAEVVLASSVARSLARRRRRGSRLVLAYHNVVAEQALPRGDTSLHLSLDLFRRQLDILERHRVPVVPLGASSNGPDEEPQVVITFDDAYAGALDLALPELTARGLPVTIFVAPGILGLAAPWWDLLSVPGTSGIPVGTRDEALQRLNGMHDAILAHAREHGWSVTAPQPEFRIGTETDVLAALGTHPGLTLGAHSWSHPNLASLSGGQLESELRRPLDWLRARCPERCVSWLAYPYGFSSAAVERAAESAGYAGAVRVSGGWGHAVDQAFATRRFNVTAGGSLRGFEARVCGLWPA